MEFRIDQLTSQWSALPAKRIIFSGNLLWAHGFAKNVPVETLLKYVDGLKAAGVQRIDFNPATTSLANPQTAAKFDALVSHIRQLGLQLAVNSIYVREDMEVKSFQDFEGIAVKMDAEWASRYKPDILVVVHEPTTMAARMGIKTTPADWHHFVVNAARAIKEASPKTRVGAGGLPLDLPFYKDFAAIPELDVLTMDIYQLGPQAVATFEEMTQIARNAHKPVYIEETWRTPFLTRELPSDYQATSAESYAEKGAGSADFEGLDSAWLKAVALFAATHDMEAVTAMNTPSFFAYATSGTGHSPSPEYNRQVKEAIAEGRHTETFRAFQTYVEKWGRGE